MYSISDSYSMYKGHRTTQLYHYWVQVYYNNYFVNSLPCFRGILPNQQHCTFARAAKPPHAHIHTSVKTDALHNHKRHSSALYYSSLVDGPSRGRYPVIPVYERTNELYRILSLNKVESFARVRQRCVNSSYSSAQRYRRR